MSNITIGFAMCGSFCTFSEVISQMEELVKEGYNVLPIMSQNAYTTDTRFGSAEGFIKRIEELCGNKIIHTIKEAEPIGPQKLCDVMLVAPCTGNTLAKISHAVTDTAVTMAVKSHLRVERPVLIALASNDAISASAENLGRLLNRKHMYFIPVSQDSPIEKPASLVAHFDLIPKCIKEALKEKQVQPIFR